MNHLHHFIILGILAAGSIHAESAPFPSPPDTQEITIPLTSTGKALAGMKLPEGFKAQLFAGEPDIHQPIGMTWDARGRLWVAECYTYAESRINYNRELRDRILIFEDQNNDGRFDKRTVFWDKGQCLTSIAVGFGGVWVTCAPELLFIPDANGDDKPDSDPVVLLDGWNDGRVRHNVVNGLKWGPDGWLYGRHGIQELSTVGKPGTPEEKRTKLKCCIWRYHPTRHIFEVVCEGTTNSWGHDWDEHGQLFFINTVIGHLWHAVPGAYFKRMHGKHFNPHLYELIGQTADHYHWDRGREKWGDLKRKGMTSPTDAAGGGHAHCGMMIYQGDNWPEKYRGRLFTVNLHGHRINSDRLERKGAGYVGLHEPDFMKAEDPWFRGIEMSYGPDGTVFLLDWSDIGECHENDGVHRSSGRIYRISHGKPIKPLHGDLGKLSSLKLAQLQLSSNEWYVRKARLILQERAAKDKSAKNLTETAEYLKEIIEKKPSIPGKLRALWTLHVIAGIDEKFLLQLLGHNNEHVRLWAIRLLADDGQAPTNQAIKAINQLAATETSGLVKLYLASVLRNLPNEKRWNIATHLAGQKEFAGDPMLPLLIWYGIEPAVPENPTNALKLAKSTQMPKLRQFISRRLTEN
jgi:putative membrane-bound dehydrogenase-like protein